MIRKYLIASLITYAKARLNAGVKPCKGGDIIEIPIFDTKTSAEKQRKKIIEESREVYYSKNKENELEELCDVIQASLNRMHQFASQSEIEKAFELHMKKIRSRGWNVENTLKVRF